MRDKASYRRRKIEGLIIIAIFLIIAWGIGQLLAEPLFHTKSVFGCPIDDCINMKLSDNWTKGYIVGLCQQK